MNDIFFCVQNRLSMFQRFQPRTFIALMTSVILNPNESEFTNTDAFFEHYLCLCHMGYSFSLWVR